MFHEWLHAILFWFNKFDDLPEWEAATNKGMV